MSWRARPSPSIGSSRRARVRKGVAATMKLRRWTTVVDLHRVDRAAEGRDQGRTRRGRRPLPARLMPGGPVPPAPCKEGQQDRHSSRPSARTGGPGTRIVDLAKKYSLAATRARPRARERHPFHSASASSSLAFQPILGTIWAVAECGPSRQETTLARAVFPTPNGWEKMKRRPPPPRRRRPSCGAVRTMPLVLHPPDVGLPADPVAVDRDVIRVAQFRIMAIRAIGLYQNGNHVALRDQHPVERADGGERSRPGFRRSASVDHRLDGRVAGAHHVARAFGLRPCQQPQ